MKFDEIQTKSIHKKKDQLDQMQIINSIKGRRYIQDNFFNF